MLLSEAIERFNDYLYSIDRSPLTAERYVRDMTFMRKFFEEKANGPVFVEDITEDDLEDLLRYLKEKDFAPNSRSRYFYTLRSFYKFASKKDIVIKDIAANMETIKLPKKERNYLTEEEVDRVVAEVHNPIIKTIVIFLYNTGLRISECRNLKLDDVDFEKKVIRVIEGKNKKDRIVPINNQLYVLLKDYLDNVRDAPESDYFFATSRSGKKSISYPHICLSLSTAAKKSGINKQVSCHVLRHSFASTLVKKKVGLVEIQKLLGHSNLAVTSIYTHTNLEALTEAVNTLNS
jgi:site-specific recombinase XerD